MAPGGQQNELQGLVAEADIMIFGSKMSVCDIENDRQKCPIPD